MKTFIKTITVAFIFTFMSVSFVYADNQNQKIRESVIQIQGIVQIIEQNPNTRDILVPFIISLVRDLQELIDNTNTLDTPDNNQEKSDTKKTSEKTTDNNRLQIDGYNPIGTDQHIAKVDFIIPVKAGGDSDLEFDGYDSFIFEIGGVEYSGTEINNLEGYSLDIENSDNQQITTGYIIQDGRSETFEITIFVDARETTKGTGNYEIELDSIEYIEIENNRNGVLAINRDSDEITLLK